MLSTPSSVACVSTIGLDSRGQNELTCDEADDKLRILQGCLDRLLKAALVEHDCDLRSCEASWSSGVLVGCWEGR